MIDKIMKLMRKREIINTIETQIVDHCNLNCYGCTHYSTLAPENFINIDNFVNDIKELSKKIILQKFRIMGGRTFIAS